MEKLFATGQFTNENLTALEEKIMSTLIDNLDYEPGFSDVDIRYLAENTGLTIRKLRNVLEKLSVKDYTTILESQDKVPIYTIYLNKSRWYLHPQWSSESKTE